MGTPPAQPAPTQQPQDAAVAYAAAADSGAIADDAKDAKHDADMDKLFAAFAAAASGGKKKEYTYDDFQRIMDNTPLFMRETPTEISEENSYVLEALKSLAFEGDGDEIALNFKQHGNELYTQKSFKDAAHAYTQGLDSKPKDVNLRITLLSNRAACNVALRQWKQVLKDTSTIIALAAANEDPSKRDPPAKALFRAAQALAGLGKWDEATDAIERGRKIPGEEDKAWWGTLITDVEKGKKADAERQERNRRKTLTEQAEKMAVAAHGLMVENTPNPPDNPHPLHFDPSALSDVPLYPPEKAAEWQVPLPYTPLIFPVFLMYPQHHTSDFITHFHEDTSFDEQLAPIFPASPSATSPPWSEWDTAHEYYTSNLVVYVETQQRRLLKVGKEITLREVITKARRDPVGSTPRDGIVLRDGLLSFVVLPKGPQERKFIDEFKRARDGK